MPGIHKYTVGQRKGLVAAGRPQYVVRIEPELNRIVIGDDPQLQDAIHGARSQLDRDRKALTEPIRCDVQIRNRFEPKPATVSLETTVKSPSNSMRRSARSRPARAPSSIGTMWLLVAAGSRTKLLQLLHRNRTLLPVQARDLYAAVHVWTGSSSKTGRSRASRWRSC